MSTSSSRSGCNGELRSRRRVMFPGSPSAMLGVGRRLRQHRMDDRMEEALRDLEHAMAAHREALAETRAARAHASKPKPPVFDPRGALMHRLAEDVQRVC